MIYLISSLKEELHLDMVKDLALKLAKTLPQHLITLNLIFLNYLVKRHSRSEHQEKLTQKCFQKEVTKQTEEFQVQEHIMLQILSEKLQISSP